MSQELLELGLLRVTLCDRLVPVLLATAADQK
jgi:hypothetical protein